VQFKLQPFAQNQTARLAFGHYVPEALVIPKIEHQFPRFG
jgi:hypothetical protein